MSQKILIDAMYSDEIRVVLWKSDEIIEFKYQNSVKRSLKGNIYLAEIDKIEPSLQATFVNYGEEKSGFLPFAFIKPNIVNNKKTSVKKNQKILVQVVKEERSNKGVTMTSYISLNGRYCTITINNKSFKISKKISDNKEKIRLSKIAKGLIDNTEYEILLIIRSAALYKTSMEIKNDFNYLIRLWDSIQNHAQTVEVPTFIYEEANVIKQTLRDLYTNEVSHIIAAGDSAYETAYEFMKLIMPKHIKKVIKYQKNIPLFVEYNIEQQIQQLLSKFVSLTSGGYLIFNHTEALVSIDVNSGKATTETNIENTAVKINLEAAAQIVKQIKLRNLSGLIVIDFIDMTLIENRSMVEKVMSAAFIGDKAKINISKISEFGLLEMTRQRIGNSIFDLNFIDCPHCEGRGKVRYLVTTAIALLKAIEGEINKIEGSKTIIEVSGAQDLILYIINFNKEYLRELEKKYNAIINLAIDNSAGYDGFFIESKPLLIKKKIDALSKVGDYYDAKQQKNVNEVISTFHEPIFFKR